MATFVSSAPAAPAASSPTAATGLLKTAKRFQGTYKAVPKVDWLILLANDFGHPDWNKLYPLNDKEQPKGILTPRMACKLFHDGVHIIRKGEEVPKFVQDLIPEIAHKQFKKKQWRKQFFEAMRRVACRLSIGLGFKPNCVAEDVFIHAILGMSFELGWRRLEAQLEPLPVSDKDRDFARVQKLGANEAVAELGKVASGGGETKAKKFVVDAKMSDPKQWFKCYEPSLNTMFDHIVALHEDDTEGWSVCSASTAESTGSARSPARSHRADSVGSTDAPAIILTPIVEETPESLTESRLSASNLAALAEQLSVNPNK